MTLDTEAPAIERTVPGLRRRRRGRLVAEPVLGVPDQPPGNRRDDGRRKGARRHRGPRADTWLINTGGIVVVLSDRPAVPDPQPVPRQPAVGRPDRRRGGGSARARDRVIVADGLLQGLLEDRRRASGLALRVPDAESRRSTIRSIRLPLGGVLSGALARRARRNHRPLSDRRLLLQLVQLLGARLQPRLPRCLPLREVPSGLRRVQRRQPLPDGPQSEPIRSGCNSRAG